MFDSTLTVPTGATASLRTGGWTGAGALFVDSVNHLLKFYSGSTWRDLVRLSDSTGTGYATQYDLTQISGGGARFGVTGEDDNTAENRAVNFHNTNTLSLDSVNAFTVSRSAIVTKG